MKTPTQTLSTLLLLIVGLERASAQGTAFNYQGRLHDGGAPAHGVYDLRFSIYDTETGGNQIGSALTNSAASVSNGLFTVEYFGDGIFTGPARD